MDYHADFEEDKFYHIINHAVGNENLFRTSENYRYFLQQYHSHTSSVWHTYAYCLMPNHFHLLVRIHNQLEIEQNPKYKGDVHKVAMQALSNWLNGYAKAYNKRYERRGALFLDFTKRILVDSESYFTTAVNYIHQNPVQHGFCRKPTDWLYSSYNSCLSEQTTRIKRTEILEWFGGKKAFVDFHESNTAGLDPDVEFGL